MSAQTVYVLHGPRGAVTFDPTIPSLIVHAANPHRSADVRPTPCPVLPAGECYHDDAGAHGATLAAWWGAGSDDAVVWAELHKWLRSYFPVRS